MYFRPEQSEANWGRQERRKKGQINKGLILVKQGGKRVMVQFELFTVL